jgi:hypothetical protein
MAIDAIDAVKRGASSGPRPAVADERLRSLLQKLFVAARRAQETPLAFEAGFYGIASAAWVEFLGDASPDERRAWRDEVALHPRLHLAMAAILGVQPTYRGSPERRFGEGETSPDFAASQEAADPRVQSFEEQKERELAAWLERTCAVVRGVDPQALEILTLRLEGYGVREAAQRLGLGLRLVQRVVADLRNAWSKE